MTEIQKSRRSRGLKSMSVATIAGASVVGLVLGTGTASAAVDGAVTVVDADGNSITVTLSDTFINGVPSLDGSPLTREWFADGKASWNVVGPTADDFEGELFLGYQVGYPLNIGGELEVTWGSPDLNFNLEAGNTSTVTGGTGLESAPGTFDVEIDNPAYTPALAAAALLETPPRVIPPKITVEVPNPNEGTLVPSGTELGLEGEGMTGSGLEFGAQLLPKADVTVGIEPNSDGITQAQSEALPIGDTQGSSTEGSGTSGSVQVAGVHGTVTGVLGNVSVRPYAAVVSATGDKAVAYGQPVRFN